MGSVMMEPDDFLTYANSTYDIRNLTTICTALDKMTSNGLFFNTNPLFFTFPLLMLQVVLSSTVILLTSRLLNPFSQPIIVSQMLGGIILGPTIFGHFIGEHVFPLRAFIVLDTLSTFGYMLYFFLVGVHIDPWFVKKLENQTIITGVSTTLVSMCLSFTCAFSITKFINVDASLEKSLPAVALQESVLAFPIIAQHLSQLNIINSEFGRKALTSSLVSTLVSFVVVDVTVVAHEQNLNHTSTTNTVFTATAFTAVIVFILRPFIIWLMNKTPKGRPVSEECIYTVFLSVLVTGFMSHAIGLHIIFGPLILGMCIPPGPPLGSAIVDKLYLITNWIFMPLYFIKNGLVMNFSSLDWHKFFVVQTTILTAASGKFLGAFLPSIIFKMPIKDAAALGLIMNAQGILELGLFKMMKKSQIISNDAFVLMCISMMVLTGVVTPTVKYLYNPSKRYVAYKRRTVMHLNSELKTLVCIHNQDYVHAIITLLETVSHSKQNPIYIYVLHLVELIARSNPTLIEHKSTKVLHSSSFGTTSSEMIINAFRQFERKKHEFISVFPFTATSSYGSMHDDVCNVALDNKVALVIIPYHTNFNINDPLQSNKKGYKILNKNVLDKAPCSVGIFVDKGLHTITRADLRSWSSFRVAVLFLGGPDDREALAIGTRMAGHPNINLTIVRLLENGNLTNHHMTQSKTDNEYVGDFRLRLAENYRFTYIEEVVVDGSGTISVIRSMEEKYELIIVGRRHNKNSPLISGIMDWNEHSELGVIGDMLASADFRGNTSILVVQQHTNVVNEHHQNHIEYFEEEPSLKNPEEMVDDEAEHIPIRSRSSKQCSKSRNED